MLTAKIVASAGIILDIAGAAILARGLIISKAEALELGQATWSSDNEEQNLKLPQVRDRLMQSRNAKIGLALLTAGFLGQLIAIWI
jgi:hypothetical protein